MKYGNRRGKRFVSSPLLLIGLLIVFAFLAKAAWNIRHKAVVSAARLSAAEAELNKLTAHKKDLERHVGYLSSEQGIEAELRTKYRAVKDGESVAVIVDDAETAAALMASSSAVLPQVPKPSWWQNFLNAIGL